MIFQCFENYHFSTLVLEDPCPNKGIGDCTKSKCLVSQGKANKVRGKDLDVKISIPEHCSVDIELDEHSSEGNRWS